MRTSNAQLLAELADLRKEIAALKVASPVATLTEAPSRYVRCAKPIPCDRLFLRKGVGATQHTCKGFTGKAHR